MISKPSDPATLVGRIVVGCVLVASVVVSSPGSATAGIHRASATQEVRWPAPPPDRVFAQIAAAGLAPGTHESLEHHVHAHLDVYVAGKHVVVPAGVGINIADAGVKHFHDGGRAAYGGIEECDQPCISPLHTHDVTGILHTESATAVDNTLGQFFTEWQVPLTPQCVDTYCTPKTRIALYVDGRRQPFSDAATIALTDHKEIALVIGRPPKHIPSTADFSQA